MPTPDRHVDHASNQRGLTSCAITDSLTLRMSWRRLLSNSSAKTAMRSTRSSTASAPTGPRSRSSRSPGRVSSSSSIHSRSTCHRCGQSWRAMRSQSSTLLLRTSKCSNSLPGPSRSGFSIHKSLPASLGMSTPSLAALHERELGVQLPKANRLTDWLERPLNNAQRDYAAADVDRLLDIHDQLTEQLVALGRLAWADEECEIMRVLETAGLGDPLEAWRKIKEARHLKGNALSVARSVAACQASGELRTSTSPYGSCCPTSPWSPWRRRHPRRLMPWPASAGRPGRRQRRTRGTNPAGSRRGCGSKLATTATAETTQRWTRSTAGGGAGRRLGQPDRP